MPLYLTNSIAGALDDEAREKIAGDITRIHCEVTGAPARFVHAFFAEGIPDLPLGAKSLLTVGSIRSGRTDEQKADIRSQLLDAIIGVTGLPGDAIGVVINETPAHWTMEDGEIMPEPGEEAAWLAAHANRTDVPA